MKQHIREASLKKRLLGLVALSLTGLVILQLANLYMDAQVSSKVIFPNFENQILEGHKRTLQAAVEIETATLGQKLKGVAAREDQVKVIMAETDPIRYFDDLSGYFFTFDLTGVRINVPIDKSKNNQNQMDATDAKGFRYVEGLVNQAKAGGGFVAYSFEKPGQGVQPKLSYVKIIPGTDILLGSGVYTDDVARERDALSAKVTSQNHKFQLITLGLFVLIAMVTVTLAYLLAQFLGKVLEQISAKLQTGSDEVAMAAGQVSTTSQSMAEGASEQAASIEQTGASLEELSCMTKRNAENAKKANGLAQQARQAADKGAADMQAMNQAMEAIRESGDDIAKIIKTIDEIAFQTNILALNAAVEAARAGEAGMGFAVVSDEVRNLAQRSAHAAKETAAKIEGAISRTVQGVEITRKVTTTLNEIVVKARQVDELVAEVAEASREQTQGITQINTAVGQMDKVTQSNAASAEEIAAAAQELNAQAISMTQVVNELKKLATGKSGHGPAARQITSPAPSRTFFQQSPAGGSNTNGSSHPLPAQSKEPASRTTQRQEIPLEDHFKNF